MKWFVLAASAVPLTAAAPTFNHDIAPIVYRYCAPCHRPGESAPFSLLTYADVKNHAAQIAAVTARRYMPPWPPESGHGDFVGSRRLSDAQIRLIADWVASGEAEGEPADLPARPQFTEGWQMGKPDLIVQIPEPYRLAAGGSDVFRNFVVPLNLTQTKYVRGLELRPGNKRIVHHANVWIDRRHTLRRRDGEDGQPGFPGMDAGSETRSDFFEPDSHFLFWKPGTVLRPEPDDMTWRLDPGTDLILNLHLQPSGKEELVQPYIALYFSPRAPSRFPMLIQLEHDGALDIPPGAANFEVTDHLKLPVDVDVLAIYPHAHYLGKEIEAWATLPDGSRRPLIRIPDWDINWQGVYTYAQPVSLPKGTTVAMRITYDNSASNARNPSRTPKRVRAGPRSEDEMGHVWLQVLPTNETEEDPRFPLQEAVMRRRLEKYPSDFIAHCNLGSLLEMRSAYPEAIAHFQQALKIEPASATARNGLAGAYLAESRLDDAIREYRETLRIDPNHRNARWNLARALLINHDSAGAALELEALLRQDPNDVEAHVSLGTLYVRQNRYDDALPHYSEAVRLKPQDANFRTNLGGLLAVRGDLTGAVREFDEALRLDPNNQTAEQYRSRALAALSAKRK